MEKKREQKRMHSRIEDLVDVDIKSKIPGLKPVIKTKTRDISAGGMKVFLHKYVLAGKKVTLEISLPGASNSIIAEAEVVNSDIVAVVGDVGREVLYETRFEFTKITAKERKEIIRYVYETRKKRHQAKTKK